MSDGYPLVPLGAVLHPVSRPERVDSLATYRILGAHWYAKGLYTKDVRTGTEIQWKSYVSHDSVGHRYGLFRCYWFGINVSSNGNVVVSSWHMFENEPSARVGKAP